HRTLVNQKNSTDILFKPAFDKLELNKKKLKTYPDTLNKLKNTPIKPLKFLPLHTTFEIKKKSKTLNINFIIIDKKSSY
ncbi:hypothetical protein DF186_24380, partial [Enterococcus hirae]